jgi:hypothetical protein
MHGALQPMESYLRKTENRKRVPLKEGLRERGGLPYNEQLPDKHECDRAARSERHHSMAENHA